ncbi:MAG: DNA polymerase Y family protein [Aquabacterium sp.]|uniref:DNA polymerase Y family protein n=1 Tax=Aquabacterium sp. TaxID=1872578 RepID=UPI003BE446E4
MLHWTAFLPAAQPESGALSVEAFGWWALQFSPRVACLEDAVVLEWQSSQRLFGGPERLRCRLEAESRQHGAQACAHASTALAALAWARQHALHPGNAPHAPGATPDWARLDWQTVSALAAHAHTLSRLGCRTVADVLALPRGGISRRFGESVLHALDQLCGLRPETFTWLDLPAVFEHRVLLSARIDTAAGLICAIEPVLPMLCAWLAGQHAGLNALHLRWHHGHRRHGEEAGEHLIRVSTPTHDAHRLSKLIQEHLQHIRLAAPVEEINLRVDDFQAVEASCSALFPESGTALLHAAEGAPTPAARKAQREARAALVDQLSARLGSDRVLQGHVHADHRPECAQRWLPASHVMALPPAPSPPDWPQPTWLLPQPLPLATLADAHGQHSHPFYQGRLELIAGPHRIESGWWDAPASAEAVVRDYFLASSAIAGLLWIFRARPVASGDEPRWFLHGFFA